MEEAIKSRIQQALVELGIGQVAFALEYPADMAHGDLACNVALVAAKQAGMNPRELAGRIVDTLGNIEGVKELTVAGPGFINISCIEEYFFETIQKATVAENTWGMSPSREGKTVMVEYTQPNPFKPFHIGHLMSNTIGESVARLMETQGSQVIRANYQGDIGLHVAKALWGMRALNVASDDIDGIGRAYAYAHEQYESDERAKEEIIELNKKGFAERYGFPAEYDAGRAASLEHFEELYRVLGTTFDYYFFESECEPVGRALVDEGSAQSVFVPSEGAVVFPGEQHGLHTRVFLTKYGTTTYETRELGLAVLKRERATFDTNYTVTAVEQEQYFSVVVKALSLMRPELAEVFRHVPHGMMTLTSGKMSSRKGNVITGESLLRDMRISALEKMADRDLSDDEKREVADMVAVAAIKYMVLRQGTGKNIVFDPEASLSFEGDSGPYLQYAHTRAVSVLKKAEAEHIVPSIMGESDSPIWETTELERLLVRFPSIVARAQRELEPHYVTTYLTELAGVFNSWYAHEKIVDPADPTSPYKVALTDAFRSTMKNGLHLLGIKAPERM